MSISYQDETAEERAVRIDDILKKNSSQGVCISCLEDIRGDEPMLETIHGPYHDFPKACIEGRPGFE